MVLSLFYKLGVLRWDLTCYTFDLFSKLLELQERCGILSEFESQLLKIVQSVRKCHATSIDEIIRLLGCTYHSIDSSERNVTNMARLYSQCMLWKWFLFMLGVKLICRKKPQINKCLPRYYCLDQLAVNPKWRREIRRSWTTYGTRKWKSINVSRAKRVKIWEQSCKS